MKKATLFFSFLMGAVLPWTAFGDPCKPAVSPGIYSIQIEKKYKRLPAHLYVPNGYNCKKPIPLVVSLHGYAGTGEGTASYLGLKNSYNKEGFALLLPEGTQDLAGTQSWDVAGYCCGKKTGTNDAGYLLQLVSTVRNYLNINPKVISFIGHSNGGFMAYRIACEKKNPASRIVSVAGAMYKNTNQCVPSQSLSVLQIHGTKDDVIFYDGNSDYLSAPNTTAFWAKTNKCSSSSIVQSHSDFTLVPGSETLPIVWPGCADSRRVELWKVEGDGHGPQFNAQGISKITQFLK